MGRINLGIVGCGWISERHTEAYQWMWENGLKYFNILATCDISKETANARAEQIAKFQGSKPVVYNDIQAMLAKGELDAVDVCTHRHGFAAIPSLQAGKHVVIEKPFGFTIKECRSIMDAVQEGKLIAVAEGSRRTPSSRVFHWCIQKGMIGAPRMMFWDDVSWWTHYRDWRHHKLQSGGGGVLDVGVHFADLWRYLFGDAEESYSITKIYEPYKYFEPPHRPYNYPYTKIYKETVVEGKIDKIKVDVEDTAFSLIKFGNDFALEWTMTSAAPRNEFSRHILYGSEGCMDFDSGKIWSEGKEYELPAMKEDMLADIDEETKDRYFPGGSDNQFVIELTDFARAVILKGNPEVDDIEGMKDLAICMAVYESSATGAPVKLKDIENGVIKFYQKEINDALAI